MRRARPTLLTIPLAALLTLTLAIPARAQELFHVDRVTEDAGVVRVYASAGLGPVEAVVRARADEAVRRAAPDLVRDRDLGTYRIRDPRIVVRSMRFARGGSSQEVDIDIDTAVTAERDDRSIVFRNYLPTVVFVPRGRVEVARARLVVGVRVRIAGPHAVVLQVLGRRLTTTEPFELNLDLESRVLHTHTEPIPDHPSIAGLVPEATALRGLEGHTLRFVVRFRRVS